MTSKKQSIQGRRITRREAYKGLGDPKAWKKEVEALDREFKAKPKTNNKCSDSGKAQKAD